MSLAAILPEFVSGHMGWVIGVLIVVVGLAYGLKDLARFSWGRVWAISGVVFDESIRRRVLWITPVAILGIIVVSQLQRPLDEQDAIRQTIKVCLFTTGLVVAVSTIILACTNLPREIENRVIYTVVTKPTTRLEIVLGKIVGFAKVSLSILLILGLFSYGYLTLRAWNMDRYIADRLAVGDLPAGTAATLQHYRDVGLLTARKLTQPADLQIYARAPQETGNARVMSGNGEGAMVVGFRPSRSKLTPKGEQNVAPGAAGVMVEIRIGYRAKESATMPSSAPAATQPGNLPYWGPFIVSPEEREKMMAAVKPRPNPSVAVEVLNRSQESIGMATSPLANRQLELTNKDGLSRVVAFIPPNVAGLMGDQQVYLRITCQSRDVEYYVEKDPVRMVVSPQPERVYAMLSQGTYEPAAVDTVIAPDVAPHFEGRSGTFGQQIRGASGGQGPVGIYSFRDAKLGGGEQAMFEARFGIERSGGDIEGDIDQLTVLSVRVRNLKTGQLSDEVEVEPESNRPAFFAVPASAVEGGDFDVLMRCKSEGHFVGLSSASMAMIGERQPFAWNLGKSLAILWLMSVLVGVISIFCSTWLSWPIAVILTLLILLGHWGVQQLGDATQPGIGNQIVTDMGLSSAPQARAVSAVVEKLSGLLNLFSAVLPDISRFAAVEEIERGVTIAAARLGDAALVALGFGLPLTVLAYVILRNKEVAP